MIVWLYNHPISKISEAGNGWQVGVEREYAHVPLFQHEATFEIVSTFISKHSIAINAHNKQNFIVFAISLMDPNKEKKIRHQKQYHLFQHTSQHKLNETAWERHKRGWTMKIATLEYRTHRVPFSFSTMDASKIRTLACFHQPPAMKTFACTAHWNRRSFIPVDNPPRLFTLQDTFPPSSPYRSLCTRHYLACTQQVLHNNKRISYISELTVCPCRKRCNFSWCVTKAEQSILWFRWLLKVSPICHCITGRRFSYCCVGYRWQKNSWTQG